MVGGGLFYAGSVASTFNSAVTHIPRAFPEAASRPTPVSTGAMNILLIGSDSRGDPTTVGQATTSNQRSDTMMLLHIDPKSSQALLLSVPRDLWVKIPGTNGKQKINAAIEIGGPKLLIQTIEQTLNVPINHYVEINFQGFKDLVSAVGGVPIYFNVPVRDAEWCYRGERGCG